MKKAKSIAKTIKDFRFSVIAEYEFKDKLDTASLKHVLNEYIQLPNYGKVQGIDFIFIALKYTNKIHEEYRKYHKKSQRILFNLKLDYAQFEQANHTEAVQQMATLFLKAIKDEIKLLKIKDFDYKRLYKDVNALFVQQKWIENQ